MIFMNKNRISMSFSDEEKTAIEAAIQTLNTLLAPKLIALSKEDRRRIQRVGDQAIPMIEKVAHYADLNPEFIPLFGNAEEFQKDFTAFNDLRVFVRPLAQLVANLEDTTRLTGSEADDFARRYYATVGQSVKMGVPGARAIYDDLRKRYETQQRGRPAKSPTENK
jgi:hypothetical protein